ncbi:MAG: EamA family transporter [Actinomycetota bacterium]
MSRSEPRLDAPGGNGLPRRGAGRGPRADLAAVSGAAALWAVAAVVADGLFEAGVEPLELALSRSVIAAAGLALIPGAWGRVRGASLVHLAALGLAIALVTATYYVAIDRLPVAVAIVLQYTGPAMVVAWTALLLRRRPGAGVLLSLAGAVSGVVLVSEVLSSQLGGVDTIGVAAGLGSALLFATYTLLSESAGRFQGPIPVLFRGFAAAAVFWIAYQAPRGFPEELLRLEHLPRVLFVGVAGTLAPFLLYLWGVQRVRAERASIAATLEPVLAALIAWIWLSQSLSLLQLAGGVLVIGAVASLQVSRDAVARRPADSPH